MMPESTILLRLNPRVRVLIWLSPAPLTEETSEFATVDYLLDGLVRRHLGQPGPWNQVSFVHTLFGENFWTVYANTESETPAQLVKALDVLIPKDKRDSVLVLDRAKMSDSWKQALAKFFSNSETV